MAREFDRSESLVGSAFGRKRSSCDSVDWVENSQ